MDQEYPWPGKGRGNCPADERTEAETDAEDDAPPAEGHCPFAPALEFVGEHRDLADQHRAAAHALEKPGDDQGCDVSRQATDERGDAESGDGQEKDPLAPV